MVSAPEKMSRLYVFLALLLNFSSSKNNEIFQKTKKAFLYHRRQFRVVLSQDITLVCSNPVGKYLFKVYNRNTRAKCKIYSKLTIKTPEQTH